MNAFIGNTQVGEEHWRSVTIPLFCDLYKISNFGRVWSIKREKCLIPQNRKDYLRVKLTNHYDSKTVSIHKLVASAFIGNCPVGLEINHKNGNKSDNRAINLEYVTKSYNTKHGYKLPHNSLIKAGSRNGRSKIDEKDVYVIKRLIASEVKVSIIANAFKISEATVYNIKNGHVWRHLT